MDELADGSIKFVSLFTRFVRVCVCEAFMYLLVSGYYM